MVDTLLSVKNLTVSFHRGEERLVAVNNVSFDISKGQILGVVGESGSGKSLSAASILRLLPPEASIDSGEIAFGQEDILRCPPERMRRIRGGEISLVSQKPVSGLNPSMTIGAHMVEAICVHNPMPRREAAALAVKALGDVGIGEPQKRMKQYPFELSGGMCQRVMIAMGLICNPRLLIADEPTTALDVTVQAQILRLIKEEQQRRGMSVIFITHNLAILSGFCDMAVVMYAGRVVEKGRVEELIASPLHPYTLGLTKAIVRLDMPSHTRLTPIPGRAGVHSDSETGCAFAPRCIRRTQECLISVPQERITDSGHSVSCLNPCKTEAEI